MARGFEGVEAWPRTGNPERRALELGKWRAAAQRLKPGEDRDFAQAFPGTADGRAMLGCVFGASPFLSTCMIREPGFLRRLWRKGPDCCAEEVCADLESFPADGGEAAARKLLRQARRRMALTVALADISAVWELEEVTEALTRLAEAACSVAFRVLLRHLVVRGALSPADPEDPEADSGLIALGLGKLGGRELNYSSDIDLILLYDQDRVPTRDRYGIPAHYLRLARKFIAALSEYTLDGQAFRVDLRLRPDPVSTPLVLSTKSAERYYATRGQTWERAALIKARPVAGDLQAARAFLATLEGFVWRQNLDFATVRDLRDIKKRIDAQHGSGTIGAHGHNLKLGRGGIREIEFFAQTHQLIWGGKDRRLRTIPTCAALRGFTAAGHIPPETTEDLIAAYRFLRRAEHRVQMVQDKQTHSLPKGPAEFETLARFLGYADGEAFVGELVGHLQRVELRYESFFEFPFPAEAPEVAGPPGAAGGDPPDQLARLGFADPEAAARIVRKWRAGSCSAARDARTRELLRSLTSPLLIAMCGTTDPDRAIARFDGLLESLDDGLQVFSLFQAHLHALETVAEIMVAAPTVERFLHGRPQLLEALVDPATDAAPPSREALAADLAAHLDAADEYADALHRLGEWVHRGRFRTCVQMLFHSLDPLDAPRILTDVADSALVALHGLASTDLAARHGRIREAGAAVLALGDLGSRAMALDSRLDLVLVYDAPEDLESDGPEPLRASAYFNQLLARLLAGLQSADERPSVYRAAVRFPRGEAASARSLRRYLEHEAAPRERLAFTRARVVASTGDFAAAQVLDLGELRRLAVRGAHDEGRSSAPPRPARWRTAVQGWVASRRSRSISWPAWQGTRPTAFLGGRTPTRCGTLRLRGRCPPATGRDCEKLGSSGPASMRCGNWASRKTGARKRQPRWNRSSGMR